MLEQIKYALFITYSRTFFNEFLQESSFPLSEYFVNEDDPYFDIDLRVGSQIVEYYSTFPDLPLKKFMMNLIYDMRIQDCQVLRIYLKQLDFYTSMSTPYRIGDKVIYTMDPSEKGDLPDMPFGTYGEIIEMTETNKSRVPSFKIKWNNGHGLITPIVRYSIDFQPDWEPLIVNEKELKKKERQLKNENS